MFRVFKFHGLVDYFVNNSRNFLTKFLINSLFFKEINSLQEKNVQLYNL